MQSEQKSVKNTRIKIIFIIILSVIFILVAYFRFFHNKLIRATNSPSTTPLAETLKVPTVYPAGTEAKKIKEAPGGGTPASGMVTRNIFAPANMTRAGAESTLKTPEKAEGKTLPEFKLNGIIADERAAIAIINGKFLKKGDSIEEYLVEKIGDKAVVLNGNGHKIVLNVIINAGN